MLSEAFAYGHARPDTELSHRRAVDRAILAMRRRMDEELSLRDLAGEALISPYHFNRVFRQIAGIPPCQFLSALRLQTAKRLLLTTQLSVTDICFEVGYSSLGTFTRRFTALVGMSPRRVRELARTDSPPLADALRLDGAPAPTSSDVTGQVAVPADFAGLVLIGLFRESLPQGHPAYCTLAAGQGPYRIPEVADGEYFLFAAGLPPTTDLTEQILCENVPRDAQRIRVRRGRVSGSTNVALRPPELIDPPILLTLPLLLHERQIAIH